jgi:AcrR family transcriptional regulator
MTTPQDVPRLYVPRLDAPRLDARVRRTRDRLGDALVELVQEKPFDAITVQDVLDRAGVARSTFYTHYSDKDDLLVSDADDFFRWFANSLAPHDERIAPVRELCAHVASAKRFRSALVAAGKLDDLMKLGQGHFARAIEARLAADPRTARLDPATRAAYAEALAGGLFALLMSWLSRGTPEPPEELDARFHRLVWNGVR